MSENSYSSPEITKLLQQWSEGKNEALDRLLPFVYEELRRRARRYLRRERRDHTLQTTALVNEVYLKFIDQKNAGWQNRAHFFAIAANMMRRILIDHAKTKHRVKRGGIADHLPLDEALLIAAEGTDVDVVALDEALNRLAEIDELQARVVELRFFGGLNISETAAALKLSEATVNREWKMAKAWLFGELTRTN